jgi:cytochrome b6-f complex iron-sulfur subunit
MTQLQSYGDVPGPPTGEITRRGFMRRMLGIGVGILSLEFLGASLAFLWPNIQEGLGGEITLGTAEDMASVNPSWAEGLPFIYNQANLFFVNVPAAKARVENEGPPPEPILDPGADVDEELPLQDRSVLALWRKCPHLGCQVPQLCDVSFWFECLCHGSKYSILGEQRAGPAPRGMDHFPISVADGAYVVNTAEVVSGPPTGTVTFDPRGPGDVAGNCTG